MPVKPMLGEIELQQVQKIETDEDQILTQHSIPALEGDFLQGLGRRATRVTLTGVMAGAEAAENLKTLREKYRDAVPVSFVADIATATKVDQVLVEEMGVRELAGRPSRFEYELTLREFIPPPKPEIEEPPPPPPPPPVETGTLVVEVIVEGESNFDFGRVTVTVDGTKEDGLALSRTLTNRTQNVWTEADFPPGQYTVRAVVTDPPMSGSATATVRASQTTQVTITLRSGVVIAKTFIVHFWFDRAFVEPCMREVLRQVAQYAENHPDEKLIIVGHTDKTNLPPDRVGPLDYNQSLSERRARGVFAYLTAGRDEVTALAEWNALRVKRPVGELPSVKDSWDVREYQHILQDLGYYSGNITEAHDSATDAAVRAFQADKGLAADGIVGDNTWAALIDDYLSQDSLAVPESQFLPNKNDEGCDSGILKWLGCSERDPVKNTEDAWRPNRRTEMLFVTADAMPCKVPQPVTFNLPTPGAVAGAWCLGPGDFNKPCCFVTRNAANAGPDKWLVQPAEPGTVTVHGSITFEDGTPAANVKYVLIAPDGEFMDGEFPDGPKRGRPMKGTTDANGEFSYPDNPKGIGIYTLEIDGPFAARLQGEPPSTAKGNVVCKRLDGSSGLFVILSPPPRIGRRVELILLTQESSEAPLVPLSQAWVYWREDASQSLLRTNEEGRLKMLRDGANHTYPWEYTERFITIVGTQVDVYYSFGAEPISSEQLEEHIDVFIPIIVPPPTSQITPDVINAGGALAFLDAKDAGSPQPSQPGQTSQATLPAQRLRLNKPADLSIWPLLWQLPTDVYHTDGFDQGATMWRAAPGDPQGGRPHPVASNLALTENSPAPAPSANARPKERGLRIEGLIDPNATGVKIKIFDANNNPIQLRPSFGAANTVLEITGTLGSPPNPGAPVPFTGDVFLFDAVNAFGRLRIQMESVGLTPPVIESSSAQLCGLQIALVDDHTANQNGQQRGPLLGEADEKIIVDFLNSPLSMPAQNAPNPMSGQSRARRMATYHLANQNRLLDPAASAGPNNPQVLKPQMPLWMGEFHIVGMNQPQLTDLMTRRYHRQHGTQTGQLVHLNLALDWQITLTWDGPDSNSPSFAGQGLPRPNQLHQYTLQAPANQSVQLHFDDQGRLTDAQGNALTVGQDGSVPDAFVPAPTAIPFPVSNRRLPLVIVSGQQRPWGRHAGATLKDALLIEHQLRIVNNQGDEIIRGGNGVQELRTVSIDGQRIDGGLIPGNGAVTPPPSNAPDLRLPHFRVRGGQLPRADIEALINALVQQFFDANQNRPRVTLLTLGMWQITAIAIINHESVGFNHFDTRGAGRRRFTQSRPAPQPSLFLAYGHEDGMPIFGAPHGYGFGQLDFIFNRGPNDDEVWSYLENLRSAVRVIMEEKATIAHQHFTNTVARENAFNALSLRRRRAIYRREIVRRYNGGREFNFIGNQWEIQATGRIGYPNQVLNTNVQYQGAQNQANFVEADFGPGI
jgi:outer membrane protein OmpA-like peptidoglycan-associated protein